MYIVRRNIIIKDKMRFISFLSLAFLSVMVIFNVFLFQKSAEGHENNNLKTIIVDKGDTLWDIVDEHTAIDYDIREVIYHVKKLNNLTTSYVYPGQELLIPIRE